jgi:thioesterase domain-containing protein
MSILIQRQFVNLDSWLRCV